MLSVCNKALSLPSLYFPQFLSPFSQGTMRACMVWKEERGLRVYVYRHRSWGDDEMKQS